MKKKAFEFYDNDEHKAGLGMRAAVSFRTNAYDKNGSRNMTKLEGIGSYDKNIKEGNSEVKKETQHTEKISRDVQPNNIVNKYVKAYIKEKKEKERNFEEFPTKSKIIIQNKPEYSRSERKEHKKDRKRSRSRDRSHRDKHRHSKK